MFQRLTWKTFVNRIHVDDLYVFYRIVARVESENFLSVTLLGIETIGNCHTA